MPLLIRAAHSQDSQAVEEVLAASYPVLMLGAYGADLLAAVLPVMTKAHPRLLGSGTYFLAEADGRPVGCGGWSLAAPGVTETEPGVAHIRHFATVSDWIGRGIGRAIYDRCEIQARAAGVELFVCYSSLNGEAFYSALGFARSDLIQVSMGPHLSFPGIRMTRSIR